jgi:hypothetical protein
MSSGWADEFLSLADRFDRAEERAYDQCTWWQRLLFRRLTLARFASRKNMPASGYGSDEL